MKNQKLFDRTIGILVNAYFNGTLEYTDCAACAIGNLIAARCNYKMHKHLTNGLVWKNEQGEEVTPMWNQVIDVGSGVLLPIRKHQNELREYGIEQLLKTEYSVIECAKIELAFF